MCACVHVCICAHLLSNVRTLQREPQRLTIYGAFDRCHSPAGSGLQRRRAGRFQADAPGEQPVHARVRA